MASNLGDAAGIADVLPGVDSEDVSGATEP